MASETAINCPSDAELQRYGLAPQYVPEQQTFASVSDKISGLALTASRRPSWWLLFLIGLGGTALRVDFQHLIHEGSMIAATVGKALFHRVRIFAKEPDVEHRGAMLAGERALSSTGRSR